MTEIAYCCIRSSTCGWHCYLSHPLASDRVDFELSALDAFDTPTQHASSSVPALVLFTLAHETVPCRAVPCQHGYWKRAEPARHGTARHGLVSVYIDTTKPRAVPCRAVLARFLGQCKRGIASVKIQASKVVGV